MVKSTQKNPWKKKAWEQFSKYIRTKYANKNGMVKCVTCGVAKHWKEMQAGHFVDSRNNSVLFNEEIVRPQCPGCNLFKHGNKVQYTLYMLSEGYTTEQISEFEKLKFDSRPMKEWEYEEVYNRYKLLNEEWENGHID